MIQPIDIFAQQKHWQIYYGLVLVFCQVLAYRSRIDPTRPDRPFRFVATNSLPGKCWFPAMNLVMCWVFKTDFDALLSHWIGWPAVLFLTLLVSALFTRTSEILQLWMGSLMLFLWSLLFHPYFLLPILPIELILRNYFLTSTAGVPLCLLTRVIGQACLSRLENQCTSHYLPEGTRYLPNRMKTGPSLKSAWKITHFPWDPVQRNFDNWRPNTTEKSVPGLPSSIRTFHATNASAISSIAATGFKNLDKLGKWFGHGIYQSSIAEVCSYYASRYYQQKKFALFIMSETKVGKCKEVQDESQKDKAMEYDTHIVLHYNAGFIKSEARTKPGLVHSFWDKVWIFFGATSVPPSQIVAVPAWEITGQEVVCKSPAQILPQYILAVEHEPFPAN